MPNAGARLIGGKGNVLISENKRSRAKGETSSSLTQKR